MDLKEKLEIQTTCFIYFSRIFSEFTLVDWQNKNELEYLLGLLIFCILKNVDKGVLAKCLKGGWMYILKKIGIWARRGH